MLRRIGEANKRSVEEVALRSNPDPNPSPSPLTAHRSPLTTHLSPSPSPLTFHPHPHPNHHPNQSRGIRTFAYGALGEPGPSAELLSSPVLRRIGEANKRSVEEVALRSNPDPHPNPNPNPTPTLTLTLTRWRCAGWCRAAVL